MEFDQPNRKAERLIWPLSDVLCTMRRRWQQHHAEGQRVRAQRGQLAEESANQLAAHRSARVYPYTKGIDLTNDGLAYGEEVGQVLASTVKGALRRTPTVSRRTRSGRQETRESDVGAAASGGRTADARTPSRAATSADAAAVQAAGDHDPQPKGRTDSAQ